MSKITTDGVSVITKETKFNFTISHGGAGWTEFVDDEGNIERIPPNKEVENLEATWCEIIETLTTPQIGSKDGSYFIRGACEPATRSDDNLDKVDFVIIDGDDGFDGFDGGDDMNDTPTPALGAVCGLLKERDISHIGFTTHSHLNPPKGIRWRIVIPTSSKDWIGNLHWVLQLFVDNNVGTRWGSEQFSKSQAWFLPRIANVDSAFESYHYEGGVLNDAMVMDAPAHVGKRLSAVRSKSMSAAKKSLLHTLRKVLVNQNFGKSRFDPNSVIPHLKVQWHKENKAEIECPWGDEHTGSSGGAVYFTPAESNDWKGGFRCLHDHCVDRNIGSIIELFNLDPKPIQKRKPKYKKPSSNIVNALRGVK